MRKGSSRTVQQQIYRPDMSVFLLIYCFVTVLSVSAQTGDVPGSWRPVNPFSEEEAPPYLLDIDVGDTEVELFMLGSWNRVLGGCDELRDPPAVVGVGETGHLGTSLSQLRDTAFRSNRRSHHIFVVL